MIRETKVYKLAFELAMKIFEVTKSFPKEEMYGLTSQIRRSSISVAANIAEGFKKKGSADKLRFMNISQGSLSETDYHLILANDLEYFKTDNLLKDVDEVGRLLESYMQGIKRNATTDSQLLSSNS